MKKKTASKPTLLNIVLNALDDLKAQNTVTLDVTRLTDVTDTLVIASGNSNRQVRALAEHAMEEAKKNGMAAMGAEGLDAGEWVLVDFGDLVLHVMQPETRAFYDLERLWTAPDAAPAPAPTPEKKPVAKTATGSPARKPAKPAAAAQNNPARKAGTGSAAIEAETQGSKARARKAPPKPGAALPSAVKKAANKGTTAKAGVLAKTGTRKPPAPKKPTTRKSPER